MRKYPFIVRNYIFPDRLSKLVLTLLHVRGGKENEEAGPRCVLTGLGS